MIRLLILEASDRWKFEASCNRFDWMMRGYSDSMTHKMLYHIEERCRSIESIGSKGHRSLFGFRVHLIQLRKISIQLSKDSEKIFSKHS